MITTSSEALTLMLALENSEPVTSTDATSLPLRLSVTPYLKLVKVHLETTISASLLSAVSPKIIALAFVFVSLPMKLQFSTVRFASFEEITLNLFWNTEIASLISTVRFMNVASASGLNTARWLNPSLISPVNLMVLLLPLITTGNVNVAPVPPFDTGRQSHL